MILQQYSYDTTAVVLERTFHLGDNVVYVMVVALVLCAPVTSTKLV